MVKKIRIIPEEELKTTSDSVVSDELLEIGKTMDWKLWEILQTMQRIEKKIIELDEATKD